MVSHWFDFQAFQEELQVREKGGHFRQLPIGLGPLCRQPVRGLRGPEGLQGRQRRGRPKPGLHQAGSQGTYHQPLPGYSLA